MSYTCLQLIEFQGWMKISVDVMEWRHLYTHIHTHKEKKGNIYDIFLQFNYQMHSMHPVLCLNNEYLTHTQKQTKKQPNFQI